MEDGKGRYVFLQVEILSPTRCGLLDEFILEEQRMKLFCAAGSGGALMLIHRIA